MVTDFNDSVPWFLGHGLHLDCAGRSWYELSGQSRHFDTPSYFVPAGQSAKNEHKKNIACISTVCPFLTVFTGNIDLLNNQKINYGVYCEYEYLQTFLWFQKWS